LFSPSPKRCFPHAQTFPSCLHETYGRDGKFLPSLNPLDTHYPTSAVPQCRGATTATRQQGSTCPVAGRDREKAMSVPRSAHDRRNAERRRVRESLAKKRKKNTPPPSGAARRPGARSAPASKLERARPAHAVPASVDISTRAQAGGSTRCCQLCDARFVVSSGAVRYFEKRGWLRRTCCYDCTTAQKQAAAAAARAVAERLKQERRPRPRGDDPVPTAVEGETQQTAGAPARAGETQQTAGASARAGDGGGPS
jgi:hypothetical protein